jgi:hypothetical protein
MAINKVVYGNDTLIDITNTTATAADVASGKVFYTKDGVQTTGTYSATTQKIYSGTSTPSSSLGNNGDIYMLMESGQTLEFYPHAYTYSNMNSSNSALGNCIGLSAEEGTSTSNVYSSGQNTTGTADYTFDLSSIPSNATITNIELQVKAHEENSSKSVCTVQLYAGSTAKGSKTTVSGTSNALYDVDCGSWTRSELDELKMRLSLGYYGGLIAGATLSITYQATAQWSGNAVGSANGWTLTSDEMYQKNNGSWSKISSITLDNIIERV